MLIIKLKPERKEILLTGVVFGFAAVLIGYFYANLDYWNPPYIFGPNFPIEDFLYGFIFGGISSSTYQLFFNKRYSKVYRKRHYESVIVFALFTISSFVILVDKLAINSIYAHIIPPLFVGFYTWFFRKDLIKPSIYSGIILTIITFMWQLIIIILLPEVIDRFWITENLLGFYILGIPFEELLFAFSLGFGGGVFYEFVFGKGYRKAM